MKTLEEWMKEKNIALHPSRFAVLASARPRVATVALGR